MQRRPTKALTEPIFPNPSLDPISGLGQNPERNVIQKSGPLYSLLRSGFGLVEFQILDIYLSRINSHDPTHCTVHIDLNELAECLKTKRLRADDLQKHLSRLGTMVRIEDPYNPKGITMVSLFTKAVVKQDEYGVWGVDLTCHPDARKYIFDIDSIGYFQYKLRSVLAIHSTYSYILFNYLEKNRSLHPGLTWEVDVDVLRSLFLLPSDAYPGFRVFNSSLLKPIIRELNEKTDCKCGYKTIKRGKYVKAVQFTLEPLPDSITQPDQEHIDLPDGIGTVDEDQTDELVRIRFAYSDPVFSSFTEAQLLELNHMAYPLRRSSDVDRFKRNIDNIMQAYDLATAEILKEYILKAKAHGAKNLYQYVRSSIAAARSLTSS